jgi:hypothetical protein
MNTDKLLKDMREAVLREEKRARDENDRYDEQQVMEEFQLCGLDYESVRELLEQAEWELTEEGKIDRYL